MSNIKEKSIFDFHFHPLFKSYIKEFEHHYPSLREVSEIIESFEINHGFWSKVEDWFLHFLDSQCSFTQILEGRVLRGFAAIAPIERMFASKKGLAGQLLNNKSVIDPMDEVYLDKIRNGEISYYHLFIKELQLYKLMADANLIKFITRHENSEKKAGESTIHLAIGMEGGHALWRNKIGKPGSKDDPFEIAPNRKSDPIYDDFIKNEILPPDESLQSLQQAMWDHGMDLMYLTLTHLSNIAGQQLATHAYGAKFLKSNLKIPVGYGLTKAGKDVVKKALTLKIDKPDEKGNQADKLSAPVLIDIKHMSLKSRKDFYTLRKKEGISYSRPIIATHIGVTGYSTSDWIDALIEAKKGNNSVPCIQIRTTPKEAGCWRVSNRTFHFNPWSINLMDDDIEEIVKSRGLIGVSLDIRILGFESRFQNLTRGVVAEYLSPEEFREAFPWYQIKEMPLESYEEEDLESEFLPSKKDAHILALCYNLAHVAAIAKSVMESHDFQPFSKDEQRLGIRSLENKDGNHWNFACIGSDFDGLIDPVKSCRNASQYLNLFKELKKWIPIAVESYEESHDCSALIENYHSDIDDLVERILFRIGDQFIKEIREMSKKSIPAVKLSAKKETAPA